jgi:23S rRNA (cytidine1920-2'-O)/16S rRNA (cytidine1409-2'-O)-methyltransferase
LKQPPKIRLDQLVVERGLADSREKARAYILAGDVLVEGQKLTKAGHTVAADARVEVAAKQPFVSRGGLKLQAALDHFAIDVTDRVCLDTGASTGGFTDCLLQRGARRVYAYDVGSGQLDWKLRTDPRVVVRENINCRYLTPADLNERVSLAVCDVSFISVTMILPALVPVLEEHGEMVILIKPQFEAGRGQVGKGGIVRDPLVHQACFDKVAAAVRSLGFRTAIMESPILGAEGNREFLLYGSH